MGLPPAFCPIPAQSQDPGAAGPGVQPGGRPQPPASQPVPAHSWDPAGSCLPPVQSSAQPGGRLQTAAARLLPSGARGPSKHGAQCGRPDSLYPRDGTAQSIPLAEMVLDQEEGPEPFKTRLFIQNSFLLSVGSWRIQLELVYANLSRGVASKG